MFKGFFQKIEQEIIQISGRDYEPGFFSLEGLLAGASHIYRAGAEIRLKLHEKGLLKKKRLDCLVVSIGNISVGGTGKTPMAIYLAELFLRLGKKPVVISRGYKGKIRIGAEVVGDGTSLLLDAETAGDEPYMMAARRSFPVVVGRDRYGAGLMALEKLNPDVILLDDGFQHIRLERDLDILLLDHERPLGNRRLLPGGRLRETLGTARKRAHAILFTRCPEKQGSQSEVEPGPGNIIQELGSLPFFATFHVPFLAKWVSAKDHGISNRLEDLKGREALLFSGISDNKSFRTTVEDLGCRVLDHLEFSDHYRYKGPDILMIKKRMEQIKADIFVTTEKDWVKLDPSLKWPRDLAVIGIQIKFKDAKGFETFIRSRLPR
ncbi:tetraacyldisaccharide 4'-kinase [Desulfospira joergensenii]|uniref:tetraacyldisaccharide 4'-kinase n=1 Tax=Desulfospira joergensenii TaxID=53329 RepID=UPI0003B3B044|nr:tetraacyldisaccharide 4'-kinase [Desulfospira joergensenii]